MFTFFSDTMKSKAPVISDPSGVFQKRDEHLSVHTNVICFKAYDSQNGLEVSWYEINTVPLTDLQKDALYSRAQTIQGFKFNTMLSIITFWFNNDRSIFYLISESINSKSILDQVKSGSEPLRLKANMKWSSAVLQSLNYLHNQPIPFPHCRICLNSIFVKPFAGIVKLMPPLINPYMLKTENNELRLRYNTAPEALFNQIGPESDIWCFAIALLYSITQKKPYEECTSPYQLYQKLRAYQPPDCLQLVTDPYARALLVSCFRPPAQRPTAAELLRHDFFKQSTSESDAAPVPCGNGIEFLFVRRTSPGGSGALPRVTGGSVDTGLAVARAGIDRSTLSTPYLG